jgi:hypothetical protein
LIIRKIFGEEQRLRSSSCRSLFQSLSTSTHLGPNIFLSNQFSNTLS